MLFPDYLIILYPDAFFIILSLLVPYKESVSTQFRAVFHLFSCSKACTSLRRHSSFCSANVSVFIECYFINWNCDEYKDL